MSGSEIIVRRAKDEDVPQMVELWKEYMEFHRKVDAVYTVADDAPQRWAEWLAEHLASEESFVLVAESGSSLVGLSLAEITHRPPVLRKQRYGAILDVAVTERFRRRGVATRLLEHTKQWFREHGIDRIELRVLSANPAASAFWRRMGFKTYLEVQYFDL
jgi:ribosomal protein S18 acetylase RimI-like enzyme